MTNEPHLIRQIQKTADPTAADALIRHYYNEIMRYAHRQCGSKHTAMDLTQSIFISMLKTIAHYNPKKAGFRTWLYRIATNKIIDYHRSQSTIKNKILNIDDIELNDDSDFVKQLANNDLAQRITKYVGTFDADVQRIFRLKIFGEYKFTEIAHMTEMPEELSKQNTTAC